MSLYLEQGLTLQQGIRGGTSAIPQNTGQQTTAFAIHQETGSVLITTNKQH